MSDELTELPEGWAWVTAETVCQIISGFAFKSVDFCAEGVPAIKIANISYGDFLWKQQEYLPISFLEKYSEFQVAPKNFLIALTRPITNNAVKVCLYPKDAPVGLLNQRVALIKPNSSYSQKLLLFFSQSDFFREQVQSNLSETLQPNLSPQALKQFFVPLPPFNEQKRIVAKIEKLRDRHQRAKQALETIPELCDRFRQSVLAAAFRGDLTADWREQNPDVESGLSFLEKILQERFALWKEEQAKKSTKHKKVERNGYKEPSEVQEGQLYNYLKDSIPTSWALVNLDTVSTLITGKTPSTTEASYWNGYIPFVTPSEIAPSGEVLPSKRLVTETGANQARMLSANSTLIVCIGTVGKVGLLSHPSIINQQINALIPLPSISEKFLYYWAQALKPWVIANAAATVNAAILNKSRLGTAPIPLPSAQEQEEIVDRIERFFRGVAQIEQQYLTVEEQIDRLNQSILAKAFRGELVEQDPKDEPASVLLDRIRAEREKAQASKSTKGRGRGSKASKGAAEQMTLPDTE